MKIQITTKGIFFDDDHSDGKSKKLTKRDKGISRLFFPENYTIIDIETTGLSPKYDYILELAAIQVQNNEVTDTFHSLVKYKYNNEIPAYITEKTGITEEMILADGKLDTEILPQFTQFIGDNLILGYNVNFDINFLYDAILTTMNQKFNNDFVDVLRIARKFYPKSRNRLEDCLNRIQIDHEQVHRGLQDCEDTLSVYKYFKQNVTPEVFTPETSTRTKKYRVFDLTTLSPVTEDIDVDNPFYQRKVCFTGKLDSFVRTTAAQAITNLGGKPQNNVTKETEYLVLGDTAYSLHGKGEVTGKLKKAKSLIEQGKDLKIINETVFLDMLVDRLNEVEN